MAAAAVGRRFQPCRPPLRETSLPADSYRQQSVEEIIDIDDGPLLDYPWLYAVEAGIGR
jgi:hypothetical protein